MRVLDRRSFLARIGFAIGSGALGALGGCSRANSRELADDEDDAASANATAPDKPPAEPLENAIEEPTRTWRSDRPLGTMTDSDTGANADAAGAGRGAASHFGLETGITDSDTGRCADPAGRGRGSGPRQNPCRER